MRASRKKFAYLLTQAEAKKKIQLEMRLAVRSAVLISMPLLLLVKFIFTIKY